MVFIDADMLGRQHPCIQLNLLWNNSIEVIYPNPRHLRAFIAVADTGSFNAAAEAVHLGQPALSQAIAKLEELVGVRLLARTTRSVELTAAGEEFLVEARRVLDAYARMMDRGADWAGLRRGAIDLFTVPSVAHRLLPSLVKEFSSAHPDLRVTVHDHPDPVLRTRLERGEGDLGIVSQGDPIPARVQLPFLRDRFRVVMQAGHPFARLDRVDAGQLATERLILLRRGSLFRSYMDAATSGLALSHAPIEVDQPGTLVGMVEAGLGVSLLPALSCPTAALRSVTSRALVKPEVFRQMAFTLQLGREPTPAVQAFIRKAIAHLSAHPEALPEGCELLGVSQQRLLRFLSGRPVSAPKASRA